MRLPWQRRPEPCRPEPLRLLLGAAGLTPGTAEVRDDLAAIRRLALAVAHRGSGVLGATLAQAERLLADAAAYPAVLRFLEDLQNVVSYGDPAFVTDEQVSALLGPRTASAWACLHAFWQDVLKWCDGQQITLSPADDVPAVANETLRALLFTTNRRVPGGSRIGPAHAVRFERATGNAVVGLEHVTAALAAAGGC
jgi:hypothetical protein